MVGWHPTVVDYAKYPGLTADKLERALRADEQRLNDIGCDTSIHFIMNAETAEGLLSDRLSENSYDVILIGAGVRKDDDHFLVFERILNAIHEYAPNSKIAFNTGPTDSDVAIRRWI